MSKKLRTIAQILSGICIVVMVIAQINIRGYSDTKSKAEHSRHVFSSIIEASQLVDEATFLLNLYETCKADKLKERCAAVENELSSKLGDSYLKEPDQYWGDDSTAWAQLHQFSIPLQSALKTPESIEVNKSSLKKSIEQLENTMIRIKQTNYTLMADNDEASIKYSLNWMALLLVIAALQCILMIVLTRRSQ